MSTIQNPKTKNIILGEINLFNFTYAIIGVFISYYLGRK